MIENDAAGKAIGYEPGKRIHLVRNPNWDKSLDYKPAYLDEIDNLQGNDDPGIASRRILDGQSMINGDFAPLPENLKEALDNTTGPAQARAGHRRPLHRAEHDDEAVRRHQRPQGGQRRHSTATRCAWRAAARPIGDIATHFLPPGTAGFEEAGGMKGTGVDFLSVDGKPNTELSAEYFKKAGYASGKYEGTEKILMVGSNVGVGGQDRRGRQGELREDGLPDHDAPGAAADDVHALLQHAVGEGRDLPERGLDRGLRRTVRRCSRRRSPARTSSTQGNSNWPQLDDPAINDAIDAAEIAPAEQRAAAWGDDRQADHRDRRPRSRGCGTRQPLIQSRERQRRRGGEQLPVGPLLDVAEVAGLDSGVNPTLDGPASPRGRRRLTGA